MNIKGNLYWGDINMADLELRKLILHFAQSNKVEGKSPKTISWYTEMLTCFVQFIESIGRSTILANFNLQTAREFIIHEQDRNLSAFTIQAKVRAIRSFSSWLLNEGYTPDNLLSNLKLPKAPVNLIEPLTPSEVDLLLNYQNPLTAIGCRNIALLITLLDTGIRESEICNLYFVDVHIEEGYLKVLGKGSKERVVPIGSLTQKMLWRYVIHFRPEPLTDANNYLFMTLDGYQLKPNAIKLLLNRWSKKAEVPRLHAHLCRHTFATNFLIYKCGDVFKLQQILGHTSLECCQSAKWDTF